MYVTCSETLVVFDPNPTRTEHQVEPNPAKNLSFDNPHRCLTTDDIEALTLFRHWRQSSSGFRFAQLKEGRCVAGIGIMSKQQKVNVPSLVDLCVWTAIDNVKYLGDVGETDIDLVAKILQHCSVDQLRHVEDSTVGRDLSPATDALWEKFYRKEFDERSFKAGDYECFREEALSTVRRKNFTSKWRFRFEVGMKMRELKERKSTSVLMEKYKKEDAKKQSKQIQICTKIPPSSKRNFFGSSGPGYNFSNTKNSLMKKSKIDLMKSKEMQNRMAMRKNAVQRTYIAPPKKKPLAVSRNNIASSSMPPKPKGRF